jgi:hypothetical protein
MPKLTRKDFEIIVYHGEGDSIWYIVYQGAVRKLFNIRQGGKKAAETWIKTRIANYKPRRRKR